MSDSTSSACPCAGAATPPQVTNAPGLDRISYRADDFIGFRRSLLRALPGEQAISTWRPAPGDLGLQVLEWWAYVGDILTFYNEQIANETYLRTARRAGSITTLVALLGYQPAPGIAATGTVAAVRSPARPTEPLTIPAGMRLSSTATPGVPAQTFEVDAAASFQGPSSRPVRLLPDPTLDTSATGPASVVLAGRVSGLRVGEQLVLVAKGFQGADDDWALVTVEGVTPAPDPSTGGVTTVVTFTSPGWGPVPTPSPPTGDPAAGPAPGPGPNAQSTAYRLIRPTAATGIWDMTPSGGDPPIVPASRSTPAFTVHLRAAVRAITAGDVVLFDGGTRASALALVTGTSDFLWTVPYPGSPSPQPPNIVVAHTALALSLTTLSSYALLDSALPGDGTPDLIGAIAVRYGFRDVGTIVGAPTTSLTQLPATVALPNTPTPYVPQPGGVTALLADAAGAGVPVRVSAGGHPSGTDAVTVDLAATGTPASAITTPLQPPLQLLFDLLPVSRGTSVTGEVLGSGNPTLTHQAFTLTKSPLTYLAAGAGATSTLTVRVDGIAWQEVGSFYGQPATARVFVVSRSPDQSVTTVTFGDGIEGARLPAGSGNVVASYRYGSGRASPPAGRLTTIGQPQPNLASIRNPVGVTGGADPQAPADVRTNAPHSVFTFGRAISAVDYEVVAAGAPGVTRVAAGWTFDPTQQRTVVTVYVGDDDAAVAAASAALAGAEDPNRPVTVSAATPIEVFLSCTLIVAADRDAPTVLAAATAAVSSSPGALFDPARMGIGQLMYRSAVDAALMVPGVVAVHDLLVTWSISVGRFRRAFGQLVDVADPGEGRFFDLAPGNCTLRTVIAGG